MRSTMNGEVEKLSMLLATARRVVAITGAGVSAESGVPTFRGEGGLWENHRPEELATPEAFRRDPLLVWRFYDWRRERIRYARPNPAHEWLAAQELEGRDFTLITQNVDGLHGLAGSARMVEVHGNLWRMRCTACGADYEDRSALEVERLGLPECKECGGLPRPAVVWFGEALDVEALERATAAVGRSDLLLVLGTSAVVYPVAALPQLAVSARVVEVNPEPTPLTPSVDISIRAPAGELFGLISARARGEKV